MRWQSLLVSVLMLSSLTADANPTFFPLVGQLARPRTVTPPLYVQQIQTSWTASGTPKSTASFSVQAGDVLVAYGVSEDSATLNISDSATLTWTLKQSSTVSNFTSIYLWTAVVPTSQTMTVTISNTITASFGAGVITFRGSSGTGNSSKSNVIGGAPILGLTTTHPNSAVVVVNGDWNATSGASRTWRATAGSLTETLYHLDAGAYTIYAGYHSNTGAPSAYNVGLTAPAGQQYTIAAIEIKGN